MKRLPIKFENPTFEGKKGHQLYGSNWQQHINDMLRQRYGNVQGIQAESGQQSGSEQSGQAKASEKGNEAGQKKGQEKESEKAGGAKEKVSEKAAGEEEKAPEKAAEKGSN